MGDIGVSFSAFGSFFFFLTGLFPSSFLSDDDKIRWDAGEGNLQFVLPAWLSDYFHIAGVVTYVVGQLLFIIFACLESVIESYTTIEWKLTGAFFVPLFLAVVGFTCLFGFAHHNRENFNRCSTIAGEVNDKRDRKAKINTFSSFIHSFIGKKKNLFERGGFSSFFFDFIHFLNFFSIINSLISKTPPSPLDK